MSDFNPYRERREVLDNILDRLMVLEADQRAVVKAMKWLVALAAAGTVTGFLILAKLS